jgi:tetratricopeptide (TPR) repeat protein
VEADGDSAEAHYYLALAAAALGSHAEAAQSLQRVAQLGRQTAPASQRPGPGGRSGSVSPAGSAPPPGGKLVLYQLALAARAARQGGQGAPVRLNCLHPAEEEAGTALPVELIEATLKGYEGPGGLAIRAEDRDRLESLLAALQSTLSADDGSTTSSPTGGRADLHGYCADALRLLGRAQEALPHARRAAELSKAPQALVRAGKLCANLGRRGEAAAMLEEAVQQGADWADVHALLAELHLELGHRAQARSHLEQALKRNARLRVDESLRRRLAA